ncbi:hypothetical protein A176_006707 [Myxococcus hansupus]|uniref:Uncharacterized protein n=1 Tax=Pseudomyxococcus hansupus TaxID=1297742 RepID=A0A0H4X889_9BACT|nr:hypothetical protein A176_006707 [Myxococcus hansupus]
MPRINLPGRKAFDAGSLMGHNARERGTLTGRLRGLRMSGVVLWGKGAGQDVPHPHRASPLGEINPGAHLEGSRHTGIQRPGYRRSPRASTGRGGRELLSRTPAAPRLLGVAPAAAGRALVGTRRFRFTVLPRIHIRQPFIIHVGGVVVNHVRLLWRPPW